jgi:hypothetical protein
MPLDTHNMRGKKTNQKNDCGLFEKCIVYQHIAPGKGQSNYTKENQAAFEGCKTWEKTRLRADWGGEIAAVICTERIGNYRQIHIMLGLHCCVVSCLLAEPTKDCTMCRLLPYRERTN